MAHYHQFDKPLFKQLIQYIAYQPNTTMLVLPRTEEQAQAIRGMHIPNLRIPQQALDGPNLLYYADMVISAGGTMNREAAILGVPTYTIYAGQIGAVDRMLTSAGRIQPLSCEEDFRNLVFVKRDRDQAAIHSNNALIDEVLNYILEEDSQ